MTKEALRHFGNGTARMIRFELDGTATLVANEGTTGPHVRVGRRWEGYPATGLTATVLRTGRAARVDDYRDIPGGQPYLAEGLRSAVACRSTSTAGCGNDRVGSGQGPLPPDTEQRMTSSPSCRDAVAMRRAGLSQTSRARIVALGRDPPADRAGPARRRSAAPRRAGSPAADGRGAIDRTWRAAYRDGGRGRGAHGRVDELREISRGIHPAILSKAGLRPALRALGRRSVVPVELDVRVDGRLSGAVEVGVTTSSRRCSPTRRSTRAPRLSR